MYFSKKVITKKEEEIFSKKEIYMRNLLKESMNQIKRNTQKASWCLNNIQLKKWRRPHTLLGFITLSYFRNERDKEKSFSY